MKYYIVNDFDRPYERNVTVEIGGKLYYIHPDLQKYGGMGMSYATPMDDFGFRTTEHYPKDNEVSFEKIAPSKAMYPNDDDRHALLIREWQGEVRFTLPMRREAERKPSDTELLDFLLNYIYLDNLGDGPDGDNACIEVVVGVPDLVRDLSCSLKDGEPRLHTEAEMEATTVRDLIAQAIREREGN